jgi:hypothetical protein
MTNVAQSEDHGSSRATKRVITWIARAISYLVYAYLIIVEIILILGFFLLLFGANPSSGFVQWAYRNLDRVMEPFRGIFSPIELGTAGNDVPAVFETSVLFAMVIYGILAILLSGGIHWLTTLLHRIDREQDEEDRRRAYADAIRQGQNQSQLDPTLPQMPAEPYPSGGAVPGTPATGAPMDPPTAQM